MTVHHQIRDGNCTVVQENCSQIKTIWRMKSNMKTKKSCCQQCRLPDITYHHPLPHHEQLLLIPINKELGAKLKLCKGHDQRKTVGAVRHLPRLPLMILKLPLVKMKKPMWARRSLKRLILGCLGWIQQKNHKYQSQGNAGLYLTQTVAVS